VRGAAQKCENSKL